jgi:hypothetical protein
MAGLFQRTLPLCRKSSVPLQPLILNLELNQVHRRFPAGFTSLDNQLTVFARIYDKFWSILGCPTAKNVTVSEMDHPRSDCRRRSAASPSLRFYRMTMARLFTPLNLRGCSSLSTFFHKYQVHIFLLPKHYC